MSDRIDLTVPLTCWKGERGTYHLVTITGEAAEALQAHEAMQRLELGARRGFGSIKVMARIGATAWKTSVFPQKKPSPKSTARGHEERQWVLLVSKKVMGLEDLAEGDPVTLELEPL